MNDTVNWTISNHKPGLPLSESGNRTYNNASGVSIVSLTTATLLLNTLVLIILLKHKSLRTPFNAYVIALLISNILYVALHNTVNILTQPYQRWWIGDGACTLYIYSQYILAGVTIHFHGLMSINRAWALFWPISYKIRHTSSVAWLLCLGVVIYLHIVQLPGVIQDRLYYRLPLENDCWLNRQAQFAWAMFMSYWIFDIPQLFVPLSYPLLAWKQLQKRKRKIPGRSIMSNLSAERNSSAQVVRTKRNGSRPFVVVTLLAVSSAVCWIPSIVYYEICNYTSPKGWETLRGVQAALFPLQALLDPIVFCISVSNLQSYMTRFCDRCPYNGRKIHGV